MASKTVGIRLEEADRQALEARAEGLGIAPGTLARDLVSAALKGTPAPARPTPTSPPVVVSAPPDPALKADVQAALAETRALRAELKGIRRNIWNLALVLLVQKAPFNAAQANQWAKDNLTG